MLKAVLFDYKGVMVNDEFIHEEILGELLLRENLRPDPDEYREVCIGKSDRTCLVDIFTSRGRLVDDKKLAQLSSLKQEAYQTKVKNLEALPIYPEIPNALQEIQNQGLPMAIVTGAFTEDVRTVLNLAGLLDYFQVIVGTELITHGKPNPEGYFQAIELLNQNNAGLDLKPSECLAIEDTPPGIQAAKAAGIQVVGVAHNYPLHMLQRWTNWSVDNLLELEWQRIGEVFKQEIMV
jgi:HAD superfamily hydrolase (TIGR01509 family)